MSAVRCRSLLGSDAVRRAKQALVFAACSFDIFLKNGCQGLDKVIVVRIQRLHQRKFSVRLAKTLRSHPRSAGGLLSFDTFDDDVRHGMTTLVILVTIYRTI